MFCNNEIDGLLEGKIYYRDGEEKIRYDISSKQNMIRMYDRNSLSFSDIKGLFYSWKTATEQAERYLMNPCFLSCNPELLYMNPGTRVLEWLFYPLDEEKTVPSDIEKLSEFLMEKVDHRDPKAMDVVYRFFKEVKGGTFLLPEIVDYVENLIVQREEDREEINTAETPYIPASKSVSGPACSSDFGPVSTSSFGPLSTAGFSSAPEAVSSSVFSRDSAEKGSLCREGLDEGFLEKVTRKIFGSSSSKRFGRKSPNTETGGRGARNKEATIGFEERNDGEDAAGQQELTGMWMTAAGEGVEETVLMGVSGEEKRQLRLVQSGQIYSLSDLPVVVGKLKKEVDICLEDPSVSRIHARFFEKEGKIYLEDLNSKNGCGVNEIKLENNETVELFPGDRITIGGVEFLYY